MQWTTDNKEDIAKNGSKFLFSNGEFKVSPTPQRTVVTNPLQIIVWGEGEQSGENTGESETFLWQLVSTIMLMGY